MKDKITVTLDAELLDTIDKEMNRHQMTNRSKFIAFILRQVLYNPRQKLRLLDKQREQALARFKTLNEDYLVLSEKVEKLEIAKEQLAAAEQKDKEKDALWDTATSTN